MNHCVHHHDGAGGTSSLHERRHQQPGPWPIGLRALSVALARCAQWSRVAGTAPNGVCELILQDHIGHCIVDTIGTGDTAAVDNPNKAIRLLMK